MQAGMQAAMQAGMQAAILAAMQAPCWLVLVLLAAGTAGSKPEVFCERYLPTPRTNATARHLHWAKPLNRLDYAVVGRAKYLYCCAVGATSIRWFKNGKQLRTTGDIDFDMFPNRHNDTIFTTYVTMNHAGNYSCIASDGKRQLHHAVDLKVTSQNNYDGKPLETERPEDNYYAHIGESTNMFCEGFVGTSRQTIMASQVIWRKVGEESQKKFASTKDKRRTIMPWRRSEKMIQGAFLEFNNISAEDFGTYVCEISNDHPESTLVFNANLVEGDDPNVRVRDRPLYKHTIIVLAVFSACFVALVTAGTRYRLEMRLFWKDVFGKLEDTDDGKEYDVFVCYDAQDADFVLGVLVATLEQSFSYRCFAYERDSIAGDLIMETYCSKIRASRRFLMVVSPSLASNAWCTYALHIAVNAMLSLQSKIICVILQNVSWPATEAEQHDPTLRQVMRIVKKVRWEAEPRRRVPLMRGDSQDDMLPSHVRCIVGSPRFWTGLRVLLPPRRPSSAVV